MKYALYVLGGGMIGCLIALVTTLLAIRLLNVGHLGFALALIVAVIWVGGWGIAGVFAGIALYDRRHPLL